jgi:hypothetical protein
LSLSIFDVDLCFFPLFLFISSPVASLSIVTGKSPCTDSHYEKVVFSRTSEADYVIEKVKMKNILVINKLDRSNAGIRHIAMEDNKTEYESYMFYQRKFWDVRKTEDEEIRMYAKQIPSQIYYNAHHRKIIPLINVKYSLLNVHFENYQDLLYS